MSKFFLWYSRYNQPISLWKIKWNIKSDQGRLYSCNKSIHFLNCHFKRFGMNAMLFCQIMTLVMFFVIIQVHLNLQVPKCVHESSCRQHLSQPHFDKLHKNKKGAKYKVTVNCSYQISFFHKIKLKLIFTSLWILILIK